MKNKLITEFEITNDKIIKLKRLIQSLYKINIDYCFCESTKNRNYSRKYLDSMEQMYFYDEDSGDMLVGITLSDLKVEAIDSEKEKEISLFLDEISSKNN